MEKHPRGEKLRPGGARLSKKGKALFRQSRILYVFLVFQTEEVGQKDGGDSQTQLCGVALQNQLFFVS